MSKTTETDHRNEAVNGRLSARTAIDRARIHLEELTGSPCEAVSALARTERGWAVTLDVLELERIPRTTDILGSYVVEIDDEGELAGYGRAARYCRGQVSDQ